MATRRVTLANGTSRGLVLDLIRSRGPISRVELAGSTGLTQATMSNVVRQLIDEGLVIEAGRGESTGGKPPVLLDVNPVARFAIGLQLGAESNTYIVANLIGAIVGRVRTAGVGETEPIRMVEVIAVEIHRLLAELGIDEDLVVGVGIVAPGPLDLDRGVILGPPHMDSWKNVSIRAMLADVLGIPVILDNDATAAAIGDFWSGSIEGGRAHATVYMGAGIGAGVLIDGTVFRGASSNSGELGQVVVTAENGKLMLLEAVADPAAVVAIVHRHEGHAARLGFGGDEFADFKLLARAAIHGDEFASRMLSDSAEHLATAVVSMVNLFDLDSVSLAGPAFSIAGSIYVHVIRRRLADEFFARAQHGVRVSLSPHVADAAAVGAAALVLQTLLAPRTMGLRPQPAHALPTQLVPRPDPLGSRTP